MRTRRPFFRSRPGSLLAVSSAVLIVVTLAIPLLPFAGLVGFVPLPPGLLATLCAVTVLYVVAAETAKHVFFRPRRAARA